MHNYSAAATDDALDGCNNNNTLSNSWQHDSMFVAINDMVKCGKKKQTKCDVQGVTHTNICTKCILYRVKSLLFANERKFLNNNN